MSEKKWEFSAHVEDDGEIVLEWYCDQHNVVTLGLDNTSDYDRVNWSVILDSKTSVGCVTSGALKRTRD